MIRSRSFVYFSLGFGVAFATLAVLSTIWSRSSHDTRNPHKRKKVIAFGDSITQHGFNTDIHGWVSKMADWWTRRVDMINRGYSGYNTRWARLMFEDVIIPEKPDFLFIFFGANDAIDVSEVHHVPLAEYTDNLRAIVGLARKVGLNYSSPKLQSYVEISSTEISDLTYRYDYPTSCLRGEFGQSKCPKGSWFGSN